MSELQQLFMNLAVAPHSSTFNGSKHQWKIIYILRHLAKAGATLKTASGEKYLCLKPDTLKRYCRKGDISFSDYTPRIPR